MMAQRIRRAEAGYRCDLLHRDVRGLEQIARFRQARLQHPLAGRHAGRLAEPPDKRPSAHACPSRQLGDRKITIEMAPRPSKNVGHMVALG